MSGHFGHRQGSEIGAGRDTEAVHFRCDGWTDAVKLLDGQGSDKGGASLGGNDEEIVRLAIARGHLRKELVVADARRSI